MQVLAALEDAVGRIEKRVRAQDRVCDRELLRDCVRAWCEELDWPSEVADVANAEYHALAEYVHRIPRAFVWPQRLKGVLSLNLDEAMHRGKLSGGEIVLIALVIGALAYVVYRLGRRERRPVEAPSVTTTPSRPRWVLVLVINAAKENVLAALRSKGVAALRGDELYQATQALWLATEAEFQSSHVLEWFRETRAVRTPSEYDVHLVRFDLSADDPGLRPNANPMDRLDAFRRLCAQRPAVIVSPRVPSDAYGTTDVFYSR